MLRPHPLCSVALAVLLLGVLRAAAAAELTVFVTGSMVDPLEHVAEDFTDATGHTLRFERATTGACSPRSAPASAATSS